MSNAYDVYKKMAKLILVVIYLLGCPKPKAVS